VVVDDVRTALFEVVVDHLTRSFTDGNPSLARFLVLDRRIRVRPMVDLDVGRLRVGLVVLHVEGTSPSQAYARFREDDPADVLRRGVLVSFEVGEDLLSAFRVEHCVSRVLAVVEVRRVDLAVQPGLDGVDGLAPLDEHAQRVHLRLLADDVEVLAPPHAEFVEVPSGELVERIDALVVTPVDEEAKPRAVGIDGRLLAVAGLIVEVEFEGSLRSGRFERFGRLLKQFLETIL